MRHRHLGVVPDFIIIGAMRCGTTSLFHYLENHPEIGLSRLKETDFFIAAKNFGRGYDWYARQFDRSKPMHGEASPNYSKQMAFPGVPQRVYAYCPHVRLVYLVRDPVERLISHLHHTQALGGLNLSYENLPYTETYANMLDASSYARNLSRYLEWFPPSQIHVMDAPALRRDPMAFLDEFCDFVGARRFVPQRSHDSNSSNELYGIPAPLRRLGKSTAMSIVRERLDPATKRMLKRMTRGLLPSRRKTKLQAPSVKLLSRIRTDLEADAAEFRRLTGRPFAHWSV